jgi:hypothetical protein
VGPLIVGFLLCPARSTRKALVDGLIGRSDSDGPGECDTSLTHRVQPMAVIDGDSDTPDAMASRASLTLSSDPGSRCPYRSRTVTTELWPALAAISRGLAPAAIQSATAVCRRGAVALMDPVAQAR